MVIVATPQKYLSRPPYIKVFIQGKENSALSLECFTVTQVRSERVIPFFLGKLFDVPAHRGKMCELVCVTSLL